MRIAIGGIVHETNTYATQSFGMTTLENFRVARGDGLLRSTGTRTYVGGMIDACHEHGYEMAPVLHAIAQPSGTIDAEVYRGLKTELVDGIEAALPVDAVVVDTHGAGVVEGIDDLEADLGAAIRLVIGPDIPLVTTLDLHGSITQEMNDLFDLMLGVYDYPHVDMYERGVEAINAVPKLLSGEWQPTTHVEQLPMLTPTSTTDVSPAKDIRQRCLDLQEEPGVLRCAFFHGFPFTDIPATGASVVVTTNGDQALAQSTAERIAEEIWTRREEFKLESLTPELALSQAIKAAQDATGPVVVNDTADNCGGGSPGDATHVLRALMETELSGPACFGFIFDPAVARQAHEAGAGATIEVELGGKHDDLHGDPIKFTAYVKTTSDGRFIYTSPMLAGVGVNFGPMVRLQISGRDDLDILVGSERSQVFDREIFALHGIDVLRYDLVVLKSSQHFRAGFADIAADIITADSPGLTTLRVENFDHPRAARPLWPIDPTAAWSPA